MLVSVSLIIFSGVILNVLLKKLKLPALLGYLVAGILFGPYVFNWVDPMILELSADIRQVALIIILTRAGLSLDIKKLIKVGRSALLMCFVPATVEILAAVIFGPLLLGLSIIQSLLVGTILAAVSPAVVVPRMVDLIDKKRGTAKQIPQMIMAGASADDVYVLVLFSAFMTMALGGSFSALVLLKIPVSIALGILGGAIIGRLLSNLFNKVKLQNVFQMSIILAISFVLMKLEAVSDGYFSGMLAIIAMNIMVYTYAHDLSVTLSDNFNKLWSIAEIFLFFLVGVSVNPINAIGQGMMPVIFIIILSLCRVLIGVRLSLINTPLNNNEKIFTMVSYLPKATVQAAIGSIPLLSGVPGGELMLTLAVLSILITAPIGAIGIDYLALRFLKQDEV